MGRWEIKKHLYFYAISNLRFNKSTLRSKFSHNFYGQSPNPATKKDIIVENMSKIGSVENTEHEVGCCTMGASIKSFVLWNFLDTHGPRTQTTTRACLNIKVSLPKLGGTLARHTARTALKLLRIIPLQNSLCLLYLQGVPNSTV